MTHVDFAAWRAQVALTQMEAAQVLGVCATQVWRWEAGRNVIPAPMALLCWLLAFPRVLEGVKEHVRFQPGGRGRKAALVSKET